MLKLTYIDILSHAFFLDEHNRTFLSYHTICEYGKNTIKLLNAWGLNIDVDISKETTEILLGEEISCFKVEDNGISIRSHITKETLEKRYIANAPDVIGIAFRNEKNLQKLNEVKECNS